MNDDSPSPAHWLWRLSATDWLLAAKGEWDQAQRRIQQRRTCVTHLRRSAGMALNAVLVHAAHHPGTRPGFDPESHWGRSYMDHIRMATADPYPLRPTLTPVLQRLADLSLHAPNPALVALRTGPSMALVHAIHDTQELLDCSAEFVGHS